MWEAMDNVWGSMKKMWVVSEWWRCLWKWCHHRKKIRAYFTGVFVLKGYFTVLCEERPWDRMKVVTLEIVSTEWHEKWPRTTGADLGHMLSEQHPSRRIYLSPEVSSHIAKISLEIDNKELARCNKDALIINKSTPQAMFWYNRDSCHVPSKQPLLWDH